MNSYLKALVVLALIYEVAGCAEHVGTAPTHAPQTQAGVVDALNKGEF